MLSLFRKKQVKNILIVCTANITRSPFFAATLVKTIKERYPQGLKKVSVSSAGVHASNGNPAHPVMQSAAMEQGITLNFHRSRRFDSKISKLAHLVLVMEEKHKQTLQERYPYLKGSVFTVLEFGREDDPVPERDIADPTGLEVEDYRAFIEVAANEVNRVFDTLMVRGYFE